MDALEAIASRRMIPRVSDVRPRRDEIGPLLELAVRAPNHHRTEPWRFYVLAGAERDRIARAMADDAVEAGGEPDGARQDAQRKVERAPVIVVFTCVPSDDPKVVRAEELASVAMAMENFLIAAYASGLGAMLRTGSAAYHASISRHLELAGSESVVGFVYVGYPAGERDVTERATAEQRTRWLGWDD